MDGEIGRNIIRGASSAIRRAMSALSSNCACNYSDSNLSFEFSNKSGRMLISCSKLADSRVAAKLATGE